MAEPNQSPAQPLASGEQAPELETTQVDAQEAQSEQPRPLTREDLMALLDERDRRQKQSIKQRTQAIEQRVQQLQDQLKGFNVEITPEVTGKIQEQVSAEFNQDQPAEQEMPGSGNPVFDWTMAIYNAEGIEIKQTDPEWRQVKAALDDPKGSMPKYQASVFRAIQAKRARTASESETASARVIGGGSSSGEPTATSARELFQRAHQRK